MWACRRINQDFFWFFHVDARPTDFTPLYEYGATFSPPLFTSVSWVHDHLLVHTNALYVGDEEEPTARFARPLLVLVQYYATLRRLAQQLRPGSPPPSRSPTPHTPRPRPRPSPPGLRVQRWTSFCARTPVVARVPRHGVS